MFFADHEIAYSVTYGRPWHAQDHLPYSEVNWLEPQLVRLLGSFILSEEFFCGPAFSFYPIPHSTFVIQCATLDLESVDVALSVKQALLSTVGDANWPACVQERWKECLSHEFRVVDSSQVNLVERALYWKHISTDDLVLMRGIQALIKADMLAKYPEFQEEAGIATFIALDASFELVLRHLRAKGVVRASAKDAGEWIYATFDEPLGVHGAKDMKFFEDFYAQRIQALHPSSRFGESPYAPICIDDYQHLRDAIPQILGFLVTGKHSESLIRSFASVKEPHNNVC
jgi:hypothetical protein